METGGKARTSDRKELHKVRHQKRPKRPKRKKREKERETEMGRKKEKETRKQPLDPVVKPQGYYGGRACHPRA